MPTVHLSLPVQVYEELKRKAAELGIQVTDLIKIFIKQGLHYGIAGPRHAANERVDLKAFEQRIKKLESMIEVINRRMMRLEGKVMENNEWYQYLLERLEMLEEQVVRERTIKKKAEYP